MSSPLYSRHIRIPSHEHTRFAATPLENFFSFSFFFFLDRIFNAEQAKQRNRDSPIDRVRISTWPIRFVSKFSIERFSSFETVSREERATLNINLVTQGNVCSRKLSNSSVRSLSIEVAVSQIPQGGGGIIIYEQDLRDAIYPLNEKRVMGAETRWLIRFNRQVMDRRNTMGETARRWPLKGSGVRSFSSLATIRYYKPATDFRIQPVETSTNLLGNLD